MKQLPIAIQLFSVREEAAADFQGTMKKIKEFGYDGVELAGLYGLSAEEIKNCLNENDLVPISAHVSIDELISDLDASLDTYKTIGCGYIAIPSLSEEQRYGGKLYHDILKAIPKIAEACKEKEMVLLYHNHDFEFAKTEQGNYALDELFSEFPTEQLQTEIDTCWVKVAGIDPVAYIEKYKGRCPLVHVKDFTNDNPVELSVLGKGKQDIKGIEAAAQQNGAKWLIIEQDDHPTGSPLENMKESIIYLRQ